MYHVLFDRKTGGLYMTPGEFCFHAYSEEDRCISVPKDAFLRETEYASEAEIKTVMWRAGFIRGYIDTELVFIGIDDILTFGRNANDIYYCQYLLTGREDCLEGIIPKQLYTICQIDGDDILFPAVYQNGHYSVLAYTDRSRITMELLQKYPGYKIVKVAFQTPVIINDEKEIFV